MSSICTPEFNEQTRKMQAELDELEAQAKVASRNTTRLNQVNKQTKTYQEKLDAGDDSPFPKRTKFQYDDDVMQAIAERNRLRKKIDRRIEDLRRRNRSLPEKIADGAIKIQRLFILSHISALQKLPVAALVRIVSNVAEEGVGSILKHVPGIKRVAELAPRHGAGFSVRADIVAGGKGIADAVRKGMMEQLLKGGDSLDATYGDKHAGAAEWANLTGRVHSMMKEPAKLNEFEKSFAKRSRHAYDQAIKKGMTEEQANEYVNRTSTKYLIGEAAYKDAMEAIMQGDNALIDATDNWLRNLSKSSVGGKVFEKLFNVMVPIKKVPANIVKETSSYAMGGIKAATAARKGLKDMTPEQADYIMKNLKKQGVGMGLMFIGYMAGQKILGGIENEFDSEKKRIGEYYKRLRGHEPIAGHIRIGGTDLNANFSHASPMTVMQAGAQYRAMREKEKNGSMFDGLSDMLQIAGSYVASEAPVLGSLSKTYQYAQKDRKAGSIVGNIITGTIIPGALQDVAKYGDYDSRKDMNTNSTLGRFLDVWGGQFSPATRKPKNIGQDIETGIPGLREKVPRR